VNTIRRRTLVLGAILAFLSPAAPSEQSQKATRLVQEDRIKKLEEQADDIEKAASSAAMEKDYITRTQKAYESYYEKVLHTQMWTLGIAGLILTAVFVFAVRFSLNSINERAKMAMADATTQTRNEFARTVAKEVQKLWDSNAADVRKLKEGLTAQMTELEKNLKDRSDFQSQFVQGLAEGFEERHADSLATFRKALRTYKAGKAQNLIETRFGATTARYIFELLRKEHGENYVKKTGEELADPLYNELEEELAVAALQTPWLTPFINEKKLADPEPATHEPVSEVRPAAPIPVVLPEEPDLTVGEEPDPYAVA